MTRRELFMVLAALSGRTWRVQPKVTTTSSNWLFQYSHFPHVELLTIVHHNIDAGSDVHVDGVTIRWEPF